ncbi:MAG: tryptophan-rich sensory protein [Anaerolineae bacterium]|jgi:hypothetical protein|nr:tryptophan-rich sensory protein [Anaerolineae bacterium]
MFKVDRDSVRQWVNIFALIITLVVNTLANALPLNGMMTGAISDSFPIFFVPAGYVFSIWGVIYLALISFIVFQARPSQRANPLLRRIGYWFALACAANSVWIFAWHWLQFPLSLVFMLTLLVSLMMIYVATRNGGRPVTRGEKWFVQVPFSIYLGWISVATIANVTNVLYDVRWDGFGIAPEVWAAIMLAVAAVLGLIMIVRHSDIAYIAVFVWAFAGIAVKHQTVAIVAGSAVAAAILVAVVLLARRVLLMQPGRPRLSAASGD